MLPFLLLAISLPCSCPPIELQPQQYYGMDGDAQLYRNPGARFELVQQIAEPTREPQRYKLVMRPSQTGGRARVYEVIE